MFTNSAGFKFRGGNFYNVSGDVHLQTHQHLTIQGLDPHEAALQLPVSSEDGRELPGIARNLRSSRPASYDISSHPRLTTSSSDHEECSGSISASSSALVPSFSAQPSHCPIPHSTPEFTNSTSRNHVIGMLGRLPEAPLPAPAHGSYSERSPVGGGFNPTSTSNSLPRSNRFHGEPAQPIGGTVNITAQNVHHNHHYENEERGIDILHRHIALEALYDSAESFPQPRCHPETRTKMLNDLYEWAVKSHSGSDSDFSMLWLYGPAGAGKSAIMQTLCVRLQDAGLLSGSFFFKRGHASRGNAQALFSTLAYQLALHDRRLKDPISRSAGDDPSVVGRGMDVQLHKLIVEPCQSLRDAPRPILLIDGLDECEGAHTQQTILSLIGQTLSNHPSIFQIIVASRPEPQIRETLAAASFRYDSVNVEKSFEDVERYFRNEFSRIHCEHSETMGSIPSPWPSSDILKMLVRKSSGYFIYAATVIKFIDDKNWRPTDQLDIVRNLANDESDESDLPFEALDKLYTQILSTVPARSRSKLCDILCIIANCRLSPGGMGHCDMERLLDLKFGDVLLVLRNVHSVLNIGSEDKAITVHHASFLDFLRDRRRSSIFFIGPDSVHHMNVACAVLRVLSCESKDPLANIARYLREALNWVEHITSIPPSKSSALVPLIRLVNLDFFWHTDHRIWATEQLLTWLKGIGCSAKDLVQRWEDYRLMFYYEDLSRQTSRSLSKAWVRTYWKQPQGRLLCPALRIFSTSVNDGSLELLDPLRAILTQSPHLARVFQAWWLLYHPKLSFFDPFGSILGRPHELFLIRILLGLSWGDMRAAICLLHPILGEEPRKFREMLLILPTLCVEIHPETFTSRDLALGSLTDIWQSVPESGFLEWGQHIRSSPHSSPELLHELREFVPHWPVYGDSWRINLQPIEFHDVVQWLKASPDPPLELIVCWQGYLEESKSRCGRAREDLTDEQLEYSSNWRRGNREEFGPRWIPAERRLWEEDDLRVWESALGIYQEIEDESQNHGMSEDKPRDEDEDM
ncbi:hypothetical protein C8R44DRAFT_672130 [Mycena epipterygia]|nr:hypothetical protein C8R44DRAFT_672130 [Mycena epipterygia]